MVLTVSWFTLIDISYRVNANIDNIVSCGCTLVQDHGTKLFAKFSLQSEQFHFPTSLQQSHFYASVLCEDECISSSFSVKQFVVDSVLFRVGCETAFCMENGIAGLQGVHFGHNL